MKTKTPKFAYVTLKDIPIALQEVMEVIQRRRHQLGSDVTLSQIWEEALEQYINAEPQQQLLKEYRIPEPQVKRLYKQLGGK